MGTIRAVKLGESEYRLRSLVVLKDYRKYGFGRVLVSALHNWVKQDANGKGHDVVQIFSHSQIPVKGFYVKYVHRQSLACLLTAVEYQVWLQT